jgi:hypothetical protein
MISEKTGDIRRAYFTNGVRLSDITTIPEHDGCAAVTSVGVLCSGCYYA